MKVLLIATSVALAYGHRHDGMKELKCDEKIVYGRCGKELEHLIGELTSWDGKGLGCAAKDFGHCVDAGKHDGEYLLCSSTATTPVRMVKPMEEWSITSKNPCRAAIAKACAVELNEITGLLKSGSDSLDTLSAKSLKAAKCLDEHGHSIEDVCESEEMEEYLSAPATDLPIALEVQKCMAEIKESCKEIGENIKSDFHHHQMQNALYDVPALLQCIGQKTTPELQCTTKFLHVIMESIVMHMRHGGDDERVKESRPIAMKVFDGEIVERRFYLELGQAPHFGGFGHFVWIPLTFVFALFSIGFCCGRRCCRRHELGHPHPDCPNHHHHHHHHHGKHCHGHKIREFFRRMCPHGHHKEAEEGIEIENSKSSNNVQVVRGDVEYQNMKTDDAAPIKNI